MRVADVRSLYDYNEWANARIFAFAAELDPEAFAAPRGSSFSSIRDTLAHTVMAEWIWLRRWRGESPTAMPGWGAAVEAAQLEARLQEVEADRADFLRGLDDEGIARPLAYRTFNGEPWSQPLADQLVHVVNHSTYHRGQIATLSRQAGLAAPPTDFIVFKRESLSEAR